MSADAEFLDTLVSMGFERMAARIALEASLNDFDGAVSLLETSQSSQTSVNVDQINQLLDHALSGGEGVQEETIANLLSTLDRLNSAKQDNAFPVLKVGDSVERGPDWKWDTQDELNGARSKGVVIDALDSDGWVGVHWAHGVRAKYRYRRGAHDVQLGSSGSDFQVAASAAAASGQHSGQWRCTSMTRYHCSIPSQVEGPLCVHGGGILQTSHWSCCGVLQLEQPCKLARRSAAVHHDSDEVNSSEFDFLMQISSSFPNIPFEIAAPIYTRLGHDEETTTQVASNISKLVDMFAPRVTAATAADAMLKCCDDVDAAAAMLLSVEDSSSPAPAFPAAPLSSPKVEEKPSCVLCMGNSPSHAFIPCGHKQLCGECAANDVILSGLAKKCPVCRQDFQCIVQIFDG